MGFPISPIAADIVMDDLEKKCRLSSIPSPILFQICGRQINIGTSQRNRHNKKDIQQL